MRARRLGRLIFLTAILLAFGAADAAAKDYERISEQLAQAVALAKRSTPEPSGYDAVFNRDPMRPLVDGQGQQIFAAGVRGGLAAQGIIWSPTHPLVVVEDELYSQGDMVGPYRIVEIRADGVVAQRDGQEVFIPLDRGAQQTSASPAEAAVSSTPVAAEPTATVPETPPADASVTPPADASKVLDPVTAALQSKTAVRHAQPTAPSQAASGSIQPLSSTDSASRH